jgi:hypothetical protein
VVKEESGEPCTVVFALIVKNRLVSVCLLAVCITCPSQWGGGRVISSRSNDFYLPELHIEEGGRRSAPCGV